MAQLVLRISAENARRIIAIIDEGGSGEIRLSFRDKRITGVQRTDNWQESQPVPSNGAPGVQLPGATGVMLTGRIT